MPRLISYLLHFYQSLLVQIQVLSNDRLPRWPTKWPPPDRFSIVDTITSKSAVFSKFHIYIDYLGQYPTRLALKCPPLSVRNGARENPDHPS